MGDPHFPFQARQLLEYGDGKEGYWTSVRFMQQMERAVRITDFKYPKSDGWRCVWIFDHSSCHTCVPEDALDVNFTQGASSESCVMGFGMVRPSP